MDNRLTLCSLIVIVSLCLVVPTIVGCGPARDVENTKLANAIEDYNRAKAKAENERDTYQQGNVNYHNPYRIELMTRLGLIVEQHNYMEDNRIPIDDDLKKWYKYNGLAGLR